MFSNLYVRGIKIKQIEADCYYKNLPVIRCIMDMDELRFNSNVTFLTSPRRKYWNCLIPALRVFHIKIRSIILLLKDSWMHRKKC